MVLEGHKTIYGKLRAYSFRFQKILIFSHFFEFLSAFMHRSILPIFAFWSSKGPSVQPENGVSHQKCRFFQSPRYVDHDITTEKETS